MSTVKFSLKNKPGGVDGPVVPNKDTLSITLPDGHEVPTGCMRSATLNMQPLQPATLVVEFFVETEN